MRFLRVPLLTPYPTISPNGIWSLCSFKPITPFWRSQLGFRQNSCTCYAAKDYGVDDDGDRDDGRDDYDDDGDEDGDDGGDDDDDDDDDGDDPDDDDSCYTCKKMYKCSMIPPMPSIVKPVGLIQQSYPGSVSYSRGLQTVRGSSISL